MKMIWLVSFLTPMLAAGQLEHSLLWKITKEGSSHKSFLFGSMHTNDSIANSFSESWWNAYDQCDVLAAEVSINDVRDQASALSAAIMKDTLLQDLYSADDYKTIMTLLEREFDPVYVNLMKGLKPFYILALIMEMPKNGESVQSVMDIRLQVLAQEKGKQIIGLETADEQASSIDVLSLNEQAELLLNYAKNEIEANKEFESLKAFYLEQNLDSLSESKAKEYFPVKLTRELVVGRNERFMRKLAGPLESSNVFCMVGAMHLQGENGLIVMLRKQGYTVEPVEFTFGTK
ncbi:MAG: TraB/GumN family protein [Flavobacteriales bacterium]